MLWAALFVLLGSKESVKHRLCFLLIAGHFDSLVRAKALLKDVNTETGLSTLETVSYKVRDAVLAIETI